MVVPRLATMARKQASRLQRKTKRLLLPSPKKATHAERQNAHASSGYTFSTAHEFVSDLGALVGSAVVLDSKSIEGGVFDAADIAFGALASGSTVKAVVLFKDSGNPSTSALLCYFDEVTGFPFTTNGGALSVPWSDGAGKIISLVA